MKEFGGAAICLERSDINTDEIIPAKYLTENTKMALKPHLLEDLLLDGQPFDHAGVTMQHVKVVISKENFGCGSSREHAVWAFEVNEINLIIAESFARIFRQNMFNCGILAVELEKAKITEIFDMKGRLNVSVDLDKGELLVSSDEVTQNDVACGFELNSFDKELVKAGGWLNYADAKY